jgi:hypothetical protein
MLAAEAAVAQAQRVVLEILAAWAETVVTALRLLFLADQLPMQVAEVVEVLPLAQSEQAGLAAEAMVVFMPHL